MAEASRTRFDVRQIDDEGAFRVTGELDTAIAARFHDMLELVINEGRGVTLDLSELTSSRGEPRA